MRKFTRWNASQAILAVSPDGEKVVRRRSVWFLVFKLLADQAYESVPITP